MNPVGCMQGKYPPTILSFSNYNAFIDGQNYIHLKAVTGAFSPWRFSYQEKNVKFGGQRDNLASKVLALHMNNPGSRPYRSDPRVQSWG